MTLDIEQLLNDVTQPFGAETDCFARRCHAARRCPAGRRPLPGAGHSAGGGLLPQQLRPAAGTGGNAAHRPGLGHAILSVVVITRPREVEPSRRVCYSRPPAAAAPRDGLERGSCARLCVGCAGGQCSTAGVALCYHPAGGERPGIALKPQESAGSCCTASMHLGPWVVRKRWVFPAEIKTIIVGSSRAREDVINWSVTAKHSTSCC